MAAYATKPRKSLSKRRPQITRPSLERDGFAYDKRADGRRQSLLRSPQPLQYDVFRACRFSEALFTGHFMLA